jgi:hypothetical protein
MKILINDKLQSASGVPKEIITPMLSDIYNAETEFTATFPQGEKINCIGIGYTDATEITIKQNNPFGSAIMNLPLISDALDISGNGNDGTPTDILWTDGVANFNGTSSVIVLNPSPVVNLTGKSVEFRFKRNGVPDSGRYERIFTIFVNGSNRTSFSILSDGKITFRYNSGGSQSSERKTNNNLCDNQWHRVVIKFINSTSLQFIVDGEPEPIQTITIPMIDHINPELRIGREADNPSCLTGQLSQFSIYDRVLTTAEIESLYNGNMSQSISLTPRTESTRKYNNGLYILDEINGTKYEISHNGTFIGRVAVGEYRKLGVNPTMEIGFYTTNESRITESGQVIPGAGGMTGRTFDADIRYKFDRDVYNDLELAYRDQISRGFPYFLLLDDEQHKLPTNMLRFYGGTDSPLSKLQSSTYKFLYSYRFEFKERF